LATESGYLGLVQTLTNHGADPNARDEFQRSPISHAAENGHQAVVEYLAKSAGAAAECPDERGLTPLFRAAIAKQWRGANATNATGRTVLSHAAESRRGDAVGLLLSVSADASIADEDGWLPLLWASGVGWDAGVGTLIQNDNSNVGHQDRHGHTALAVVSREGHKATVQILLKELGRRSG
jgi:ankyrin repeat protein